MPKSTLLSALNKFITLRSGEIKLSGTSSFVAQTAWILNTSVRNNILFGVAYDSKLYDDTLKRAQLMDDLDLLPAGDLTMIGERGVTLSGGQKQRISIARALYAESGRLFVRRPVIGSGQPRRRGFVQRRHQRKFEEQNASVGYERVAIPSASGPNRRLRGR